MTIDEVIQENVRQEENAQTYAIFLHAAQKLNIWEVGKTVAKIKKVPLVDVTARLFTCNGFIADDLTESEKDQICDLLQKLGVSHFVVKQKDVLQLPKLVITESAALDSSGFECTAGGETTKYTWDNIMLINAARFETVSRRLKLRQKGKTDEPSIVDEVIGAIGGAVGSIGARRIIVRSGSKKTKTEIVKEITYRLAIDVFVKTPCSRFRILERRDPFQAPDQNAIAAELERFRTLAQDIIRFAKETSVGDAIKALAEGRAFSDFTYQSKHKFDLLNFYLLNLVRLSAD